MSERGATPFSSIEQALTKWYGSTPYKLEAARKAFDEMVRLKGPPSSIYTTQSGQYIAITWPAAGQQRDPSGTPARMELQFFTTFIAAREPLPGWSLSPKAPSPGQTGKWYVQEFPDFTWAGRDPRPQLQRVHCQNGCDPYGPSLTVSSKCPECDEQIVAPS